MEQSQIHSLPTLSNSNDIHVLLSKKPSSVLQQKLTKLECGSVPNVMAALPNIGGVLFNAAKFSSRPVLECRAVMLPRCETR